MKELMGALFGNKFVSRKLGIAGVALYLVSQVPPVDPITTGIKIAAYALIAITFVYSQGKVNEKKVEFTQEPEEKQ